MIKCPYNMCDGSGYLEVEEDGEPVVKFCKCRKEKLNVDSLNNKLIEAHIPKRYWEYSLDSYSSLSFKPEVLENNKDSLDVFKRIMDDPLLFTNNYQLLWLWGSDENSGHTSLAIMFAKELLKIGHTARFITMHDLIKMLSDFDSKEALSSLKEPSVLIIDDACDVSRCYISVKGDFAKVALFDFIANAFNDGKYLICTSNVDIINIPDMYRELIAIFLRHKLSLEFKGTLTPIFANKKTTLFDE